MFTTNTKIQRTLEILAHVTTWCYVFLSPILFKRSGESIDWNHYLVSSTLPLTTCVAFYLNYFVLVPRLLLTSGKLRWFILANLVLFAAYHASMELMTSLSPGHTTMLVCTHPKWATQEPGHAFKDVPPRKIFFILRAFGIFAFSIAISITLRMSKKWKESERARAQAELGRSEAELKNLKNQINPHFLLNTLNNIYALTAFDPDKAQQAIMELSRMLRYMLYENQTERVSLSKEIDFLKSYIALMRLRLNSKVDVKVDFSIPEGEDIPIAPLIFISLVENAFKHGVSPTEPSFIHISLHADSRALRFVCVNSNYPKTGADKAPGGIGLKQVAQRLKLSYPDRYTWHFGPSADGKEYRSEIIITPQPTQSLS